MDRQEALKQIMGGYDDVWMKGLQVKRAAKAGQSATEASEMSPEEAGEECEPGEREPDDADDGMDEETKAQLEQLLSQ